MITNSFMSLNTHMIKYKRFQKFDFSPFKFSLRSEVVDTSQLRFIGEVIFAKQAFGEAPALRLNHPRSFIFRKRQGFNMFDVVALMP